jgi:ParB-like chromosome segregation protein Spo0J
MEIQDWPIDRVIPYARNPRKNSGAIAKVAASLREFGFRQPLVVDERGTLIVGHTRLEAARAIGLEQVPVHVAVGLSAEQARAYRLMDNRSHEEASWDEDLLALELQEISRTGFSMDLTGFDTSQLEAFMRDEAPKITGAGDQIRLDKTKPIVCPECGHEFSISAWEPKPPKVEEN